MNIGFDGPGGGLSEVVANVVWSTYVTREVGVCLIKPFGAWTFQQNGHPDGLTHLLAMLSDARMERIKLSEKATDVDIAIHSPFSLSRLSVMASVHGQSSIITRNLISRVVDCPKMDILFSCRCSSDSAVKRAIEPEALVRKMCVEHDCMADPESEVTTDWLAERFTVLDTEGGPAAAAKKAVEMIDELKGGADVRAE